MDYHFHLQHHLDVMLMQRLPKKHVDPVQWQEYLYSSMLENKPWNQLAEEILTADGADEKQRSRARFLLARDLNFDDTTRDIGRIFLGRDMQCAQCHNHPFDRWTMDDYYSFANFFSQVGRKGSEDNREIIIYNSGSGSVRHPVGNRDLPPKFLGGERPDTAGKDRRELLSKWLASDENPFFAKNLANIVWGHFMGVGIVEPVDDVRISNPPSNPELLEELGKR